MQSQSFVAPAKRGRTAGRKPRPKVSTVAEFVQVALNDPPTPPPRPPKPPRTEGRSAGVWDGMTPEERSTYAKQLAAKRKPENMARRLSGHNTPNGWTLPAANVARAAARLEALELVAKLKASGQIAADDTEGEQATLEALTIVRSPGGNTKRRQMAMRLLRHYHSELSASLI